MRYFLPVVDGIDVAPLVEQIDAQPDLWNQHPMRKITPGTPHAAMDDIWLRYNAYERLGDDRGAFNSEHIPIWYPAWRKLPAARPIIFGLMALVEAEMLCGILITRIPPGGKILPHIDRGWQPSFCDRLYVALRSPVGSYFRCDCGNGVTETLAPSVGDVHMFDNTRPHWVDNNSDEWKMTMIISLRTDFFGRY
jgi:hypothetical protein